METLSKRVAEVYVEEPLDALADWPTELDP